MNVVVTGIGLTTPLANDRENSWAGLIGGKCAVRPLATDGWPGQAARLTGGVRDGGVPCSLSPDDNPRTVQLALNAAREALADAGFPLGADLGERWGCLVSNSKPIFYQGILEPGVVPQTVARGFGVAGPVMNLASACATGLQSVMSAASWIRDGLCDFALAGAAESSLHELYLSGFERMGVISSDHRVRPFDRKRDGFVVGEGAGVFVLESDDSARRRGAQIYGCLRGWDFACDPHHPTRFNSNGQKIAASLVRALGRSGMSPSEIGYVNAHGTATQLNDRLESLALHNVFGKDSPAISSTKGATGHLLGATGAVELAFCLLALRDGVLPPTLHLENPESDALDFIGPSSRRKSIDAAATLSFGFGGSIAALVLSKA